MTNPLGDQVAGEQPAAWGDLDELAAQERDEDPEGDPGALDVGAAEPYADEDPDPVMNADAGDDFADLVDGDDDGDTDLEDDDA